MNIGVDTAENELRINPIRVRVITRNVKRSYVVNNYAYGLLSAGLEKRQEGWCATGLCDCTEHPAWNAADYVCSNSKLERIFSNFIYSVTSSKF